MSKPRTSTECLDEADRLGKQLYALVDDEQRVFLDRLHRDPHFNWEYLKFSHTLQKRHYVDGQLVCTDAYWAEAIAGDKEWEAFARATPDFVAGGEA